MGVFGVEGVACAYVFAHYTYVWQVFVCACIHVPQHIESAQILDRLTARG